ncbi:hypothetical protein Bca4012_044137 [Brassica carinata]|uniref:Uncharacterized protein n=1 Tax=Brassica carinata TaxID=52824 RepID=A0A8X7QXL9_BRACI|nr:hypothetical protein Bca52824_058318 [Brassica carinata]
MKLVNLEKETRKIKKMILIFLCCLCVAAIESVGKHIPMAFMVSYCLLAGIDEAADKLQEVSFGQITSSEAMWTSSVKLGGAEVQSPKTRDGITTNENGDHEYVEYNNSSTTSPCQDHSPWLSA